MTAPYRCPKCDKEVEPAESTRESRTYGGELEDVYTAKVCPFCGTEVVCE